MKHPIHDPDDPASHSTKNTSKKSIHGFPCCRIWVNIHLLFSHHLDQRQRISIYWGYFDLGWTLCRLIVHVGPPEGLLSHVLPHGVRDRRQGLFAVPTMEFPCS